MNYYSNELSLKDVILDIIKKGNLSYGIDKVQAKEAWKAIMGNGILEYTQNIRLQGDKLFITINNASLKENLSFRRSELALSVNNYLQKEVVKEIIFL